MVRLYIQNIYFLGLAVQFFKLVPNKMIKTAMLQVRTKIKNW